VIVVCNVVGTSGTCLVRGASANRGFRSVPGFSGAALLVFDPDTQQAPVAQTGTNALISPDYGDVFRDVGPLLKTT
jgi:hypothetical protein